MVSTPRAAAPAERASLKSAGKISAFAILPNARSRLCRERPTARKRMPRRSNSAPTALPMAPPAPKIATFCMFTSVAPAGCAPPRYYVLHAVRGFVFALCALSAVAAEAPKLRLPEDVRPVRYAADLTLVPGEKTFSGAIDIDIELAKPAPLIWLNATELTIRQATIASQPAAIEPGNDDFVGLRPAKTLPAGKARIHIVYQGKISEKSSAGIFQGLEGKQPYLFTQFESIDARRAFPCFDQPDFKTPWQMTLHVPRSMPPSPIRRRSAKPTNPTA